MRRTTLWCGLSLLGLCAWTGTSAAQVVVRGPFGRTWVAVQPTPTGGTVVKAPLVLVQTGPPVVVPPPPPVVIQQPPPPVIVQPPPPQPLVQPPPPQQLVVPPPPAVVLPTKPLTHAEFARIFQPLPGTYSVVLVHPGSGAPVPVTFTLPAGNPRVRVLHRNLIFDYGRHEVDIRFAIHGKVKVIAR